VPADQQVEVDDHEQIVERVAAIDVAKASGMVCIRVPHPAKPGRRVTKVWQVPATTNAIIELAEQLACQGINASWSSPPPTTGGPGCTCWKPAAWWCGW
jgi:hypothetical protein